MVVPVFLRSTGERKIEDIHAVRDGVPGTCGELIECLLHVYITYIFILGPMMQQNGGWKP